ncbi:MAG: polysaccharide deacetylase family protein [Polaromonas sp.]|nr:polysaccharide deacetylase family protein [Polaromonas sp.]
MYHQIAEPPPKGAPYRSLYVSPEAFARQLDLFRKMGYTGLSMGNLLPYLRGEKRGKVVGITFDDGYQNNLTQALPILQRHGFSSTCYAVGGLLGQTNLWDKDAGIAQVPLMDPQGLQRWVQGGQEVGAHTFKHINLLAEADAVCRSDIAQCKDVLEAATGVKQAHFCYPYGRYRRIHTVMAREAGYQTATTTRRGRYRGEADLLQLPRITVARSTTLLALWLKIVTPYEDYRGVRESRRQAALDP